MNNYLNMKSPQISRGDRVCSCLRVRNTKIIIDPIELIECMNE